MMGTTQRRIPLPFPDRQAAGLLLGAQLRERLGAQAGQEPLTQVQPGPGAPVQQGSVAGPDARGGLPALVLGLPRGGVAVGAEVARILGAPLDVLVTRKIGYPPRPELGLGAIAEGGEPVYDHRLLATIGLEPADLLATAEREREELARRVRLYRGGQPPPDVSGRLILLVDDGIATGVTARAALRAIRARGAGRTILAVPVAPPAAAAQMMREADDVVVLASPAAFRSVGEWYVSFGQLSDADVLSLLARARARTRALRRVPAAARRLRRGRMDYESLGWGMRAVRRRWRGASCAGARRRALPRSGRPKHRTSPAGTARSSGIPPGPGNRRIRPWPCAPGSHAPAGAHRRDRRRG